MERRSPDTWPLEILDRVLVGGVTVEAERTATRLGLGTIAIDARVRVRRLQTRPGQAEPGWPDTRAA